MNREIRDALEMISHRMALENVAVRMELDEKLPAVSAHSHRLGQVILNLLANAMEAIQAKDKADGNRSGGTILIRTEADGDRVIVSVEDTGIGIPEHHLDRVMEPFFTTKDASRGKGLGLSICSQIVKGYGGTIRARSKDRPGAAIEMVLPRAEMP